ncbi:MAG: IS1 family transposase [Bacteroidota bacterium]|jgi:IS1 family transposase
MNCLPIEKKALILTLLSEGNSIRSIERISGCSKHTISRLLLEAGEKAKEIHDREMMNLRVNFLQVDEIWTFVARKQKQIKQHEINNPDIGDQYVFVALDQQTKLVPAFRVGKRTLKLASSFMTELRTRIDTIFQLSTDAFAGYWNAVDRVFGNDIHYAQIHKHYGEEPRGEKRYSPANIISVTKRVLLGEPDPQKISTSHVERQNLTMRMQMRRFTRLTNAFSKKLEYLEAAIALHFFHYNFMRIHQTLRVTPAMQSGISRHLWTWEEFLGFGKRQSEAA